MLVLSLFIIYIINLIYINIDVSFESYDHFTIQSILSHYLFVFYNSNLNFTSVMANTPEDDDLSSQRKKPSSRVCKQLYYLH